MKINYLVATINNFNIKKNIFISLSKQTNLNFKLIIVHQGDSYFNKKIVSGLDFKYIRLKKYGLSFARNYGLEYCDDGHVVIMDDDSCIDINFNENIHNLILNEKNKIFSGLIIDPISNKLLSRSIRKNKTSIIQIEHYRYFMSSALVIPLKLLNRYKFDENFGLGSTYGSAEETDLFFKLIRNEKIFFEPSIVVYHDSDFNKISSFTIKQSYLRGFNYGKGFGAVLKKHFLLSKKFFFMSEFIKSTIVYFFVILHDLKFFNIKIVFRNIGSLLGRFYGFFKYKK